MKTTFKPILLGICVVCCYACGTSRAVQPSAMKPAKNTVVAHRGAWKKAGVPQNSLASLRAAINLGCTGTEFDIRMTSDDSLVINHDAEYQGMDIETTTYQDLARVKLRNGETLPTLTSYIREGLKNNSGTLLVAEIKPSTTSKERGQAIAKKVWETFRNEKATHAVQYISFDYDMLKKIESLDSSAFTQYLEGDRTPQQLKLDGIDAADYNGAIYKKHPEWINEAKRLGVKLNVWTINDSARIKSFANDGFHYITTDEPELALSLLLP